MSDALRKFSEEDLVSEIARRQKRNIPAPSPVPNPDFAPLISMIVEGMKTSIEQEYEDDDFKHYVYEAALTAVYGDAYWPWRNGQKW